MLKNLSNLIKLYIISNYLKEKYLVSDLQIQYSIDIFVIIKSVKKTEMILVQSQSLEQINLKKQLKQKNIQINQLKQTIVMVQSELDWHQEWMSSCIFQKDNAIMQSKRFKRQLQKEKQQKRVLIQSQVQNQKNNLTKIIKLQTDNLQTQIKSLKAQLQQKQQIIQSYQEQQQRLNNINEILSNEIQLAFEQQLKIQQTKNCQIQKLKNEIKIEKNRFIEEKNKLISSFAAIFLMKHQQQRIWKTQYASLEIQLSKSEKSLLQLKDIVKELNEVLEDKQHLNASLRRFVDKLHIDIRANQEQLKQKDQKIKDLQKAQRDMIQRQYQKMIEFNKSGVQKIQKEEEENLQDTNIQS